MDDKPTPTRRLYPISEACARLGDISRSGFYKLVGQGVIRVVHLGKRSFVTDDEIENVVARIEAAERREPENRSAKVAV